MSDYLSNLAAKSLKLTPVLEPRLASLFEPLAGAGRPVAGRSPGLETVDSEQALDETVMVAPAPAQPSVVPPPPTAGLRLPVDLLQLQLGDLAALPGWGPRPPMPASVAPRQSATRPEPPPSPPVPGAAQPAVLQTPAPALLPSSAVGDEIGAARSRNGAGQEPLPIATSNSTRSPAPVAIAAHPHATPSVVPAAPASGPRTATPEPAPIIRVTIGRIDVRAVMPPAPPPRRATPPMPRLSLDEYLRKRSGGER